MDTTALQAAHHRAVDVPRLRDRLLEGWRTGYLQLLLGSHPQTKMHLPVRSRDEKRQLNHLWTIAEWEQWAVERLAEAELFYVTADMTDLVSQAAAATPSYEVYQDRLPAQVGFVVYERPFCKVPAEVLEPGMRVELMAALWGPVPDVGGRAEGPQPGLMCITLQDTDVLMYTQPTDHMHASPSAIRRAVEDQRSTLGPLAYHEEYPLPFGITPWGSEPGQPVNNNAVAALFTTWILMGQKKIAAVADEAMPRHIRKQATREGRPEPKVRTVDIRQAPRARVPREQEGQPDEPSRVYSVRWPVKGYGYWRETWYPSRERHELQYVHVPSYIKGPQGAPMIGGERVNVLRR